ncbi:hypothetical protein HZS_1394 [Henneguya salminicola]|nr:hypothetical protein HZS_1394 [Henneguya salminicola]
MLKRRNEQKTESVYAIQTKSHVLEKVRQYRNVLELNAYNFLDPRLRSTQDGRRFVRRVWHEDIDDVDHTTIIFASEESCSVLLKQGEISIDATFKTCPPGYKHTSSSWVTIHQHASIFLAFSAS